MSMCTNLQRSRCSNVERKITRRGVFFSGCFDGAFKERAMRAVAEEVRSRAPFVEVLIVDAAKARGAGHAELTLDLLAKMELMVPFVFDNYGQFTGNPSSSFGEVRYCLEHQREVQCLPLKLYRTKRWPPVPQDHDGRNDGAEQNELFFRADLLYKEFPIHNYSELSASEVAMADCIIDRYLEMHPELQWRDCRPILMAGEHVQRYLRRLACGSPKKSEDKSEIDTWPGDEKGGEKGGAAAVKEGDPVGHMSLGGSTGNCMVLLVGANGCYLDINTNAEAALPSVHPKWREASDAILLYGWRRGWEASLPCCGALHF